MFLLTTPSQNIVAEWGNRRTNRSDLHRSSAHEVYKIPWLSLDAARRMTPGSEAKANKMGRRKIVAVVGMAQPARLKRMKGRIVSCSGSLRRKTETSTKFPFSSQFIDMLPVGRMAEVMGYGPASRLPCLVAVAGDLQIKVDDIADEYGYEFEYEYEYEFGDSAKLDSERYVGVEVSSSVFAAMKIRSQASPHDVREA